jgi:acylphosphatase
VHGWVRNRRDGSVEAFVQGPPDAVDRVVGWAQRGPPASRVTAVDVAAAEADPALGAFAMMPTT